VLEYSSIDQYWLKSVNFTQRDTGICIWVIKNIFKLSFTRSLICILFMLYMLYKSAHSSAQKCIDRRVLKIRDIKQYKMSISYSFLRIAFLEWSRFLFARIAVDIKRKAVFDTFLCSSNWYYWARSRSKCYLNSSALIILSSRMLHNIVTAPARLSFLVPSIELSSICI